MSVIAQTKTDQIENRIDKTVTGALVMSQRGPAVPVFQNMGEILEFAKIMAVSGIAVREHLRNNPGVCAAICMQANRWQMDPFAVANKSYAVNNQVAYESQLIASVINMRAPIKGRLKTRFVGEGQNRKCIASGWLIGDDEPTEVESPPISQINPKNSPLWKTDPDQQLAYYTKRSWARRECPEVLLGVYDSDELVTQSAPVRPMRNDYVGRPATQVTDVTHSEHQEPSEADQLAADRAAVEFAETGVEPPNSEALIEDISAFEDAAQLAHWWDSSVVREKVQYFADQAETHDEICAAFRARRDALKSRAA